LFHPEAGDYLKHGFDQLADLLAATLGPTQGAILSSPGTGSRPEMITDAATVARRMLALPHRAEDVGAMILRNLVWRMHRKAGDGCATAAVLAQAILRQAHRFRVAGANAMSLKKGVDRATAVACKALWQMARPLTNPDDLVLLAQGVTNDLNLSRVIGEIFARFGPEAYVILEDYAAPYLERAYYPGGRWQGRLASPYLITDHVTQRAILHDCQVALYNGDINDLDELRPLLDQVTQTDRHRLLVVAREIKGTALSTLIANHQEGGLPAVAAVLRRPGARAQDDFDDLAILTGATVLSPETGRPLASIRGVDLGSAARVEADAEEVIVVGEGHNPETVGAQIAALRARFERVSPDDEAWDDLRFRLARLRGQIARLMIGAYTETERAVIRQKAEKALRTLPVALRQGIVPGGGVAYLDAIPAVQQVEAEGDEARGVAIVAGALTEPFLRIVRNAGVASPAALLDEARRRGPGVGYDVQTEMIGDMYEAGVIDAAGVVVQALEVAVSGAMMALTTEAIVLQSRPETSYEP